MVDNVVEDVESVEEGLEVVDEDDAEDEMDEELLVVGWEVWTETRVEADVDVFVEDVVSLPVLTTFPGDVKRYEEPSPRIAARAIMAAI